MTAEQRSSMRLTLSDEEAQFKASVERLIDKDYDLDRHQRTIEQNHSFDRNFWSQIADLGWIGACLPESVGGYAQSGTEGLLILEQFGRGLVVEPLLSAVFAPAAALFELPGEEYDGLLADLVAGKTLLALAWSEPGRCFDPEPVHVHAHRTFGGWRLNGQKSAVLNAPWADFLVVSAASLEGPCLFLVPRAGTGVSLKPHMTIDGQRAADIVFDGVEVDDAAIIGAAGNGLLPLTAALDRGGAGACAEAVGAMAAGLELTLEYAQTRKQFGQTIGTFQVIQHRLAKMATDLEYARSLLPLLGARLEAKPAQRSIAISAVRAKISASARGVLADAVQLHGGIGVTHEAAVSHYFRRVTALDLAWGDSRFHLKRYRLNRPPGHDFFTG